MIDAKKFVWAHMLEGGKLTNGKWSYYGAGWEDVTNNWTKNEAAFTDLKKKIKTVGIDWSKTNEPSSSMESAFTDTFHDADSVEALIGVLVLKDGTQHTIGHSNSDLNFGQYVRMITELNNNQQKIKDILGE